jgi:hypothetical protein
MANHISVLVWLGQVKIKTTGANNKFIEKLIWHTN